TYSPNDVNENGTLVLRSSNVKDGEVVVADNVYVDTEKVTSENVKVGDIVVVVRNGSKALIGKHAVIKESMPNTVIGAFMSGIRTDIPFFVNALLDTKWFEKEIEKNMGATINQITGYMFSNMEFIIPSIAEQSAIGTFFSTLDRHITLHQRKLDKLKSVKQAYLSEMFPAEGERVPKRRFPGFTDDWELRKLGEVVYRSNLISSSKDLPRLEFEDINSGLGTLNKDISQKLDYRKGLEFNVGDVLFGKLRPYLKNWWYAEFKGIALGDFWNLKSDLWHSCFLYTYIQSNSFQLVANDTSGTKMPRSDWNLVAESIAKFPSLPEQEVIGTFFSTLDRQITLHQRKSI
ncbi:MAG: restriction endonuclease subunit S, partial [Streptococcus suis]